jgi:SAM-dependent methyltransferase
MFEKTARYYDKIYAFKDYAAEVAKLTKVVRERIGDRKGSLLDVACGTGKHLEFLAESFDVEGLDISEELLALARERLPDVPLHCGDMRSFRLPRRFDAITCLFSAIGYMTDVDDLVRALETMADHLNSGGLLIVEPWITPDEWRPNTVHALLVDEPELKIARVSTSPPAVDGRLSCVDLHHLIGTSEGTWHVVERHELALYTVDEMTSAFEVCGLDADYDPDGLTGRGLYVAQRVER